MQWVELSLVMHNPVHWVVQRHKMLHWIYQSRLMGTPVLEVPTGVVIETAVAKIDGVHGGVANTVTHTKPSVGSKRWFM